MAVFGSEDFARVRSSRSIWRLIFPIGAPISVDDYVNHLPQAGGHQ